jgi:hypothetical protein
MPRHGERQRRGPEVHRRFEPSRLAEACLSEAYARLVPPVWRQVYTPSHVQAFGADPRLHPQEAREEGRQCS